ncbi:MAG: GNAT family N-acetyltransferase [Paludibacteraceae bacterium]|nr:GNAT family N-acetyltransferase [Paludibacteraceae bacterium]
MEQVIERVKRELILAELTPDKFLRHTNKGGNEIYVTTAAESPNIMREIGRLRELSFRIPGGGSGKALDVDEFDTMKRPYKQLFVWDPVNQEILGGYRFIHGRDVTYDANGQPMFATAELFRFSEKFKKEYIPVTLELGRSFVHPDYQATKMGTKSIFALDNLWDGLGAIMITEKNTKYLFGKVTVYQQYNADARNLIFAFIDKYFHDTENLVVAMCPLDNPISREIANEIFNAGDYKEDFKLLNHKVRELGVNVPPLVNAYIGLAPCMKTFGASYCKSLGGVIEFGLLIPQDQIYEEKKCRHIESFLAERNERTKSNL